MNTTSDTPLLSADKLSKRYFTYEKLFSNSRNEFYAVKNVSLDIYKGENIGIVGQSGCGKTTLASMLVGILEPDGGELRYNGSSVSRRTSVYREYRQKVQMVFQNPDMSLNPKLKIGSVLDDLLMPRLKDKRAVRMEQKRLMEITGLAVEHLDRYPMELSGGQKQRVSLARALAVDPALIIADEPVSNLDVSVQAQILNLMNDLNKTLGITFVLISHDLAVVSWLCEKIAVMQDGVIIEYGGTEQVIGYPKERHTKILVDSAC